MWSSYNFEIQKKFKGGEKVDVITKIGKEILSKNEFIFQYETGIMVILIKKYEKLFDLKRKIIIQLLGKEEEIILDDEDVQVIFFKEH